MNSGKTVFAKLMDFINAYEFRKCVERYNGNRKVISFSCWDQFLCMAFAQLTYRESLRNIQACLRATQSKLYHLGIRGKVFRNTLAHANQNRDWRIYADFTQTLIVKARKFYAGDSFGIELDQAASQNQGLLWHHRKRSQNSDMDCHLRLCSRRHREKDLESGPESLHNSTGFERDAIRENAHFTGTCKNNLHK